VAILVRHQQAITWHHRYGKLYVYFHFGLIVSIGVLLPLIPCSFMIPCTKRPPGNLVSPEARQGIVENVTLCNTKTVSSALISYRTKFMRSCLVSMKGPSSLPLAPAVDILYSERPSVHASRITMKVSSEYHKLSVDILA